jgi:peptidoglycan/xylan/chitin deacetylase (PgdA/CDA1 family)
LLKKFSAFAILLILSASIASVTLSIPMTKASAVPVWDFEDHGYSHSDVITLTSGQIVDELQLVNSLFAAHGLPTPQHYAYPDGAYNETAISVLSQYRLTGRTAGGGSVFPETYPVSEWYSMSSAAVDENTTFSQVKTWIDNAVVAKGLLNLFTHQISDPAISIGINATMLGQILDYLVVQQNAGNLSVLTMRQAYSGFNGQRAVVVMAFDDGFRTDYTVVWPMFKARGLTGTSYITCATIENSTADALTWAMISEMSPPAPKGPVAVAWALQAQASSSMGGNTSLQANLWICPTGDLSVTAYPAAGYVFSYWLFDGVNMTANPVVLPIQTYATYHNLTAVFTKTVLST